VKYLLQTYSELSQNAMRGRNYHIAISREVRARLDPRPLESTKATITGQTEATAAVAESAEISMESGPTTNHPEGAISGLSNLKRKMDKIGQERELFQR
jgi:hypothetical protein